MNSRRDSVKFYFNFIRCIPHLVMFYTHKNKPLIQADMKRGLELLNKDYGQLVGLIYLFAFNKAFRNIFYFRVEPYDFFLDLICPRIPSLIFETNHIGEGLAISHGFATAIGAKYIGNNCTVFQQVTIGSATHYGSPTILDNVTIYAGAVIIGNITIGNNVNIGANATVFRDVPDNCTVLPGTSRVMRWKIQE